MAWQPMMSVRPPQRSRPTGVRPRTEDLHRRIAGSELVIYPDSGHGGIFQFPATFAPVAVEFLDR
jgi:pimeloyl-ACP methyl ester carboxylesterase